MQQAWRLHYKRLRPEQLDAVHNSSMATVSDYSSNSGKFSTSSFTDSIKNSLSDEKILQISYDGSREDEEQEPVDSEGNDSERGCHHRPDDEVDGEISGAVKDDNEQFEWSGGASGEASETFPEEPASEGELEGMCDEFWTQGNQGSWANSEFDEWKDYHEDDKAVALQSDEERLHEFEDILGPEEHAELWESHQYSTFQVCNLTVTFLS